MDIYQATYKMPHSTTTTLRRMLNGILMQFNEANAVVPVLMDLAGEVDTIDHAILLIGLNVVVSNGLSLI